MQQAIVFTWTIGYRSGTLAIVTSTIVIAIGTLMTGDASARSIADTATTAPKANIVVADHQSQRHCHTIRTRVYCHSSGPLPVNWPPLTMTPRQGKKGSGAQGHARGSDDAAGNAAPAHSATALSIYRIHSLDGLPSRHQWITRHAATTIGPAVYPQLSHEFGGNAFQPFVPLAEVAATRFAPSALRRTAPSSHSILPSIAR